MQGYLSWLRPCMKIQFNGNISRLNTCSAMKEERNFRHVLGGRGWPTKLNGAAEV